jgi:aminopeptidase N
MKWRINVVGNDQIRAPWLDESLARYAELRFYQLVYPDDADWWYGYFILGRNRPNPNGAIDLGIADYDSSKAYIDAVYRRGLIFLNDLRRTLGTDVMDDILKDYYTTEQYKITHRDAFFDAISRHTAQDISAIVKGYFAAQVDLPCRISDAAPGCRR